MLARKAGIAVSLSLTELVSSLRDSKSALSAESPKIVAILSATVKASGERHLLLWWKPLFARTFFSFIIGSLHHFKARKKYNKKARSIGHDSDTDLILRWFIYAVRHIIKW